ncbi:MAG: helix-turn-helix domain-containing protein [Clostridia bacterium]|nr:helix-turn-helix domain-containing protein [Clostridia bacterium]
MKSMKNGTGHLCRVQQEFQIGAFCSAFEQEWDATYSFGGEQHDFWEAVYVVSGEVESVEDDRVYRLRSGDLLFHAPLEFHKIRSAGNTAPHVCIMSFYARGTVPLSLKNGIFPLSETHSEEYLQIFHRIAEAYDGERPPYQTQLCAMELSAFLIRLSTEEGRAQLSQAPSAQVYRLAVQTMQARLSENCTLQELADTCHVSVSYLKLLFRRYAGISPKAYYSKMRYDEALRLLQEGFSVAETAERLNFSSPNYFSAFIKRYTGQPPARYIKTRQ